MTFAQTERAALCDLLLQVGPAAPTLCEGWDTHDLAAHLWLRETDPLGSLGFFLPRFEARTRRRMDEVESRWAFPDLVERIRVGPARFSVFGLPGVDARANFAEYFVHHEDVRRAGGAPADPRTLDGDVEDRIWSQLRLMARGFFRRSGVGVVLERAGARRGHAVRVAPGAPVVTVRGRPGELLLYAFGRRAVADVRLIGEPEALTALHGAGR